MMTRSDVSTYSSSSLARPRHDIVHARAAVLRGHGNPQQAELRHLREDAAIEPMRPIQFANSRSHFAARPFADRLLEQTLLVGEVEVHHQRVAGWDGGSRLGGLPEQYLAKVAFEQELFGDAQLFEHPLDVAVRHRPLLAACGRVRAVLKRRLVDDDVTGVLGLGARLRFGGDEEREEDAFRLQDSRELLGQLPR